MRWKKYIFHVVAVLIIIALFSMYRIEHGLYKKTKTLNYSLVQQLRSLKAKNQQISQAIGQISGRQDEQEFGETTFIDRKKYFRMNWKNYIHVSLNDYKTGFLGGIHGLKVTVKNDTEYDLDNVAVTVSYRRSNGEVFKTEKMVLNNIPSKKSVSIAAPDSRKGMKVEFSLQRITSQAMNFCWEANKKVSPGETDPYECVPSK